jgi:iron complex outermembrane receptor protein
LNGKTEIAELFRRLAGVDLMETTGSQTELSLRGFNQRLSNKVLILVDGRSVFVDLIGATLWQTLSISPDDIERIEVVRGPGSALYGADAFNGVINIITKAPGEGRSGFTLGTGTSLETHGSVWATGRDKDFAYRASAGYDFLPRWSREAPGGRADLHLFTGDQDTSGRSYRFDMRATQQLGKDVTFGIGGGFVKLDTLEILAIGPVNDFILQGQTSDVTAFLRSKHFELRAFWNNFNVTHGNNAAQIGQSLIPGRAKIDIIDGEFQYINQFNTGEKIAHDLHIGIGYRFKGVQWTYQDRDRYENHESFYIHDEIKLGERFAIVGDYRVDYVPYLEKLVQSPRVSVLFHPSKQSTVRGIVATAFRTPTFLESYLGIPVQLPFAGGSLQSEGVRSDNPSFKLKPEQIFTTELGYLNQDSDYVTFDSAFFFNKANNLIQLAPNRPLTVGDLASGQGSLSSSTGLYPLFLGGFENQCQTFNVYGAELGVRAFPIEGLDLFATYTLNYIHQDNSGCSNEQLALIVTDKRTSLNKGHIGGQVRTKKGFDFELAFHYYSPQDWAEQIVNLQKQRIEYQSFHIEAYYTMNATASYRFLQNRANISVVAFNALDNQHREHPFGQLVQRKIMTFFGYTF